MGDATAIPDDDAASQNILNGTSVEVAGYPGVHVEPPQPVEEEEPLFRCFCHGVGVVRPGQVLADVNPKKPEAAESLHRSPIDGDEHLSFSLSLPVVHNELLCFADIMSSLLMTQLWWA